MLEHLLQKEGLPSAALQKGFIDGENDRQLTATSCRIAPFCSSGHIISHPHRKPGFIVCSYPMSGVALYASQEDKIFKLGY